MLPDWVKAIVRQQIDENLSQSCTIERYEDVASSGLGAPKRRLVSSFECACFLTKEQGQADSKLNEADKGRVFYMLQLPYDADIRDGDTVLIAGESYETRQVLRSQSQDVMRQARLVKAGS